MVPSTAAGLVSGAENRLRPCTDGIKYTMHPFVVLAKDQRIQEKPAAPNKDGNGMIPRCETALAQEVSDAPM